MICLLIQSGHMFCLQKINKPEAGFTIIELLIAIFLLAVVVSTMFGAYTDIFHTIKITENDTRLYKMAKKCLERVLMDLESIYVASPPIWKKPGINDDDPDPYRIVGDFSEAGDSNVSQLRFTSFAHVPGYGESRKEGIARIVYYAAVHDQDENNILLKRSDSLDIKEEFEEKETDVTICEWVKSFQLTYFDEEEEYQDTWDSESKSNEFATPRAILIKLEVTDPKLDDSSDVEPIVFQTRATLFMYRDKKK